jgi:hypothetical protein
MPKFKRRELLNSLTKPELQALTLRVFGKSYGRLPKHNLVDMLTSTRVFTTESMLELLTCQSLKRICKILDVESGSTKSATIAVLLDDTLLAAGELVRQSLRRQGFRISKNSVTPPNLLNKSSIREVHALAVQHKRDVAENALKRVEDRLLERIANGPDIDPHDIKPTLRFVQAGSQDELLFRYATLHWSIPISTGYGRRLRALVVDESNEKLIGVIGLCDPVFALRSRDSWIGWNIEQRKANISGIVDAYVLGAVPPYSQLLCGKLVAMLACSDEVRERFRRKYHESTSLIGGKVHNGLIAAITTTSALGRSSIYNRLKIGSHTVFEPIGFTAGSGDFQFLNGAYEVIQDAVKICGVASAKHEKWGNGYRNRREVVQEFLKATGIASSALQHGIQREVFVAPLASNARDYLKGVDEQPEYYSMPTDFIAEAFLNRWMLRRVEWDKSYLLFEKESWRLWRQ